MIFVHQPTEFMSVVIAVSILAITGLTAVTARAITQCIKDRKLANEITAEYINGKRSNK